MTVVGNARTHHETRKRLRKRLRAEGRSEEEIESVVAELAERQRQSRTIASGSTPRKRRVGKPEGGPALPKVRNTKRDTVISLNGPLCAYCGRDMTDRDTPPGFTVDHVVPLIRGGTNAIANLVACCERCNHTKGHRLLGELGWTIHPAALERRVGVHALGPLVPPDVAAP